MARRTPDGGVLSAIEAVPGATRLVAFDTSTERLAMAVHSGQGSWVIDAEGGAAASATLLPQLQVLVTEAGLVLADLDAIAYGRGPGAFTGLRTACAVAQGLGFGLGKPLLPIDSLLIVAEDARQQASTPASPDLATQSAVPPSSSKDFEIAVAVDARMSEVYAARYAYRLAHASGAPHGTWRELQAPALVPLAALSEHWNGPVVALAGSALSAFGASAVLPPGAKPFATVQDRAGALLRLAQAAWRAGAGVAAAEGLPLYLRDKVAQTTAERAAMKAVQPVAPAASNPAELP